MSMKRGLFLLIIRRIGDKNFHLLQVRVPYNKKSKNSINVSWKTCLWLLYMTIKLSTFGFLEEPH